jgi:hypothetical protein
MWLLIPEGFYSIVQKDGETDLCVRARVADDLDRLRDTYLPTLTPTIETPGGDYRYRAWIGRGDLATGMSEIAQRLDYSNFKNEVARHDPDRAHTYSHVWGILGELQPGGPYST